MESKYSFEKLVGTRARTRFLELFYYTNFIQININKVSFIICKMRICKFTGWLR